MRAVVFTGAGGREVVAVLERPDPVPAAGEVLVAVRWAGLNPADLVQRAGRYPAPPGAPADVPGLEVAGTVAAVGPGVSAVEPGQRVFGLVAGGGLAQRVLVHERHLAPVPDALTDIEAAAVPEAYMTAHDAVRTQAGLVVGETLLVHGAAGGVGGAAVRIGLEAGARVLAVVRRPEAAERVRALGAEAVDDASFVDEVRDATGGRGADVVLELVGAPHFPGDLEAGAEGARIVVVGVGGGATAEVPLYTLMRRRQTLRGTVLRSRSLEEKALVTRRFEREVLPALAAGRMRPEIEEVVPVEKVADAYDALAAGGRQGKLLVDLGPS